MNDNHITSPQNIEIPLPESEYIVRQDRKTLQIGEAYLEINGNHFPIENIRPFGILICSNQWQQIHPEDIEAKLIIKGNFIERLHLKPVREFIKNGQRYIAFENLGSPIQIENLEVLHRVTNVLERNTKNIIFPNINNNFKNIIFNFYYWLKKTEEDINNFQMDYFYFSKENLEEYESTIINYCSEYLKKNIHYFLNELESEINSLPEKEKKQHYHYFREILGDFFDQSYLAYRSYHKPRGYAGDYEMMRLIYQNIPRGKTLFGKCMDKFFLSAMESEAVRNRALYLEKKIKIFLKKKPNSKIVSFGCGIAKEIQNLIFSSPHIIKEAEIYLIDQDIEALKVA